MPVEKTINQEIHRVFQLQKANRIDLSKTTASQRKSKLKIMLSEIMSMQDEICNVVYKDFRKSKEETKLTEIFPVVSEIRHTIRNLNKWMQPHRVPTPLSFYGSINKVMYESIGQLLIISPWNFPFLLAIGPLISAIAAGNAIIMKPSERSPITSELLQNIIDKLFPEEEVKVFLGGAEVAKELTSLPFNHIFFTGSTVVGKLVMEAASKNLAKATLELGGKSPVIVSNDADIKTSAKRIAWAKFMNAGQTCIAPDYLLVHEDVKEKLIPEIIKSVEYHYGVKDELKKENNYCRIINGTQFYNIKSLIEDAVNKNGKIIYGGETDDNDNLISPTLIDNVSMDSEIMKIEIFGPVLPIITYKNEDEILTIIEKNPNPLALYIFSKKKKFIDKMLKSIPAGGAGVNDVVVHFVNYNLPFGGINQSGLGKAHGFYGYKTFSNEKSIMKQRKYSALMFLYPPYNKIKNKLIDIVIKYF